MLGAFYNRDALPPKGALWMKQCINYDVHASSGGNNEKF